MYYLYVLQSIDRKHFYIGSSSDLVQRLKKHNNGSSKATKPYRPWEMIYQEEFFTKEDAAKSEYYTTRTSLYLEKTKLIKA